MIHEKSYVYPPIFLILGCVAGLLSAGSAAAQTRAYVADSGANAVYVLDTATNSVVATVPVASGPSFVAAAPNGAFVYVVQAGGVSRISTATNTVVATVPIATPKQIAITPDSAFAYVTSDVVDPNDDLRKVFVIDTASNAVVTTIRTGQNLNGAAVTPDGAFVWVISVEDTPDVHIIDTATNTLAVPASALLDLTFGVAFTPDGAFAYVTSFSSGVSAISTASHTVVAIIPAPFGSGSIAITPNGARAYVANVASGDVAVIDTATNSVVTTLSAGSSGGFVAVTPDGARAYVTSGTQLAAIDTATNTVSAIPLGTNLSGIAITNLPSPQDQLAGIIAEIHALVAQGALAANKGDALINKIEQVIAKLEAGQTGAACNQMGAFINQVNAFVSGGALAPADGQSLIDSANAIRASLGCQP